MVKFLISFFLIFSSTFLFCAEFKLKDRLQKARPHEYFVTEANQMTTLVAIRSVSPTTLLLEEITAPNKNLKTKPASWAEWIKAKAPGHTSWSMIEIDLKEGELLECYSFSRSSWIQLSGQESLFATLLQLPLKPAAPDALRRIGPPPLPGEPDRRKIWTPPLTAEGKKIEGAQFDVFETVWPQDGSELAGKSLSLYFDKEKRYPLPFWIQIDAAHASAILRTVDTGKNLPSPHRALPRRIPEFVGQPQKNAECLRLFVKAPKYYRGFELFAVDAADPSATLLPVPFALAHQENELLTFDLEQADLAEVLEPGHRYTWLLVPIGHKECYTRSHKPFVWQNL